MNKRSIIASTRTIPFPVEKVWDAWTNPEIFAKWWGPKGFTNTIHQFDFRVGGRCKFTMHGPDAGHYENEMEITFIAAPDRITWKRITQPYFHVDVSFEAVGDKQTKILWHMIFDSEETYRKIVQFAPEKNEENLDRLEAVLMS